MSDDPQLRANVTQLLSQNMLSKMNKRCTKMTRIYCIVTNDSFIAYNVASQEYMQSAVERFQCTVATCIVNITATQQYMENSQHSSAWVAATCIYGIYASQQYMKNALTRFSWVVATRRLMK